MYVENILTYHLPRHEAVFAKNQLGSVVFDGLAFNVWRLFRTNNSTIQIGNSFQLIYRLLIQKLRREY